MQNPYTGTSSGGSLGFGQRPPTQVNNPWLQQQAQGIVGNITQNLQNNILPKISHGSMAAGGFGDTRMGIAQGLAIQGANRDATNAMANLYGQAYESEANRDAQAWMAGQNNANALAIAQMGNATQQRGQDIGLQTAQMGNATTIRGQDQQFQLGQQNANTNAQQVSNQYNLGLGNLALGDRQATQQYNLGLGNLGVAQQNANTGAQGVANQYQLGLQQNEIGRANANANTQQVANQFALGQGNLALGNRQADQSYNLGLGNLALGNRNTDINQAVAGSNMFTNTVNNALAWNNALYQSGANQMNAPMNALNQFGQFAGQWAPYTGQGAPSQGGGWTGALGGALTAAQVWQMLNRGG